MDSQIWIIIISLLFSAFFSGIEIAFVSSDKLQIQLQAEKGVATGRILSNFVKYPSRFIGATLVGNTVALVVYGAYMTEELRPVIISFLPAVLNNDVILMIVQTVVSTLLVLLTAEFLPKSLFMANPNRMLSLLAWPMRVIYIIMYIPTLLIVALSKLMIVNVFRLEYSEDKPVFNLTDLNNYIQSTLLSSDSDANVEVDTKIFNNALEFKTIRVRECMIPRTEIIAIDIEDPITDIKQAFINSGHSKILIYKDSIDEVIGYCHSLELFKKPKEIEQILTPIIIVPETMLANELMIQFISERKSLALVVDEFGGTSGIVSIEDIMEEIFGEIQDEHDVEDLTEQKIDDANYLLSARHEIDYLNDKYNWNLPQGDYETLGGLILSVTEDIPQKGQMVSISAYTFTIQSTQNIRIELVKLSLKEGSSKIK